MEEKATTALQEDTCLDQITEDWLCHIRIRENRVRDVFTYLDNEDLLDRTTWVAFPQSMGASGVKHGDDGLKLGEYNKIWNEMHSGAQGVNVGGNRSYPSDIDMLDVYRHVALSTHKRLAELAPDDFGMLYFAWPQQLTTSQTSLPQRSLCFSWPLQLESHSYREIEDYLKFFIPDIENLTHQDIPGDDIIDPTILLKLFGASTLAFSTDFLSRELDLLIEIKNSIRVLKGIKDGVPIDTTKAPVDTTEDLNLDELLEALANRMEEIAALEPKPTKRRRLGTPRCRRFESYFADVPSRKMIVNCDSSILQTMGQLIMYQLRNPTTRPVGLCTSLDCGERSWLCCFIPRGDLLAFFEGGTYEEIALKRANESGELSEVQRKFDAIGQLRSSAFESEELSSDHLPSSPQEIKRILREQTKGTVLVIASILFEDVLSVFNHLGHADPRAFEYKIGGSVRKENCEHLHSITCLEEFQNDCFEEIREYYSPNNESDEEDNLERYIDGSGWHEPGWDAQNLDSNIFMPTWRWMLDHRTKCTADGIRFLPLAFPTNDDSA